MKRLGLSAPKHVKTVRPVLNFDLKTLRLRAFAGYIPRSSSAPLMLRVAALQLLFELRVSIAPERRQILRDLYRSIARRKYFDAQRNFPVGDPQRIGDAVEVLNARRDGRRSVGGIQDFDHTPPGQLNPLRSVLLDP